MAQYSVNPQRLDPYKNFKFRLKWDGLYACGLRDLAELKRSLSTEVVDYRAGGDPSTSHKSPGRTKYDSITLERGLTQDLSFSNWAALVWNYGSSLGAEVSLANFRKNIILELYNEAGQLLVVYKVDHCWATFPNLSMVLYSPSGFHPALSRLRRDLAVERL